MISIRQSASAVVREPVRDGRRLCVGRSAPHRDLTFRGRCVALAAPAHPQSPLHAGARAQRRVLSHLIEINGQREHRIDRECDRESDPRVTPRVSITVQDSARARLGRSFGDRPLARLAGPGSRTRAEATDAQVPFIIRASDRRRWFLPVSQRGEVVSHLHGGARVSLAQERDQ